MSAALGVIGIIYCITFGMAVWGNRHLLRVGRIGLRIEIHFLVHRNFAPRATLPPRDGLQTQARLTQRNIKPIWGALFRPFPKASLLVPQ